MKMIIYRVLHEISSLLVKIVPDVTWTDWRDESNKKTIFFKCVFNIFNVFFKVIGIFHVGKIYSFMEKYTQIFLRYDFQMILD